MILWYICYMQKLVKKRDGSLEPFEQEKIMRVVISAGLESDKAHTLSVQVAAWVNTLPKADISSLEIRDKVLELLTVTDENVADFYRWYQKTKG